MKPQPYISVIVTTHHRPGLLSRCIQSIVGQAFEDSEIILCADESSAPTKQVAQQQLRAHDSFVCLPNFRGPAGTRNFGVNAARGKWLCFLDDDDTFSPHYFSSAVPLLERNPDSLHYFNHTKITEEHNGTTIVETGRESVEVGNRTLDTLYVGNFVPNNSFFLPGSIAKNNLTDTALQSHEDWDLLIALLGHTPFIHHPLNGPNVHVNSADSRNNTAIRSNSNVLDYLSIYRKWPGKTEEIRNIRKQILATAGISLPSEFL